MLDIATKKLTDIFIPKKEVRNVIFSPDGAQLMIWDQKNVPEEDDQRSYVHIFDLATKTGHVIRKSHDTSMFHLLSWRSDGKVIVAELMGETSGLWSMDVKSGHMKKTPVNASAGPMSDNGMMMAIVKNTITDICNHLSGTSPSAYNVVDPVSGDVRGVIDGKSESIFVLAFSPDGSEVLYRAAKPWDKEDRCGHAQKWRYYKKHLTSGDTVALTDKSETLRLWDRDYVGAEAVYGNGETLNKIVVDGETIAMAQSWCEVIGEYYSAQ